MSGSSWAPSDVEITVSPPTPSNAEQINQRSFGNVNIKAPSPNRMSRKYDRRRRSSNKDWSQMKYLSPKARGEMFNPERKY